MIYTNIPSTKQSKEKKESLWFAPARISGSAKKKYCPISIHMLGELELPYISGEKLEREEGWP